MLPLAFRKTVSALTKLAEIMNAVIATLLFSACYLLLVPIFHLLLRPSDPLRLRSRSAPGTFWITRHQAPPDPRSFERMA